MGVTQQGTDLLPGPSDGEYKDVPLGTPPPALHLLASLTRPVEALGVRGGNGCSEPHGGKDPKGRREGGR